MNTKSSKGLSPAFSPLGIWAISIGTSIGWGSFIITCNTYLLKAGILGTAFGLLIGMGIILVITWNLQYMIQSRPDAGGIYSFERSVGGKDLGFLALWFVLLGYLAVLWANITAVPLFARFFLGSTFQFGFHYQIFGYEVWMGEVLLSVCSIGLVGFLCAHSSRLPDRIMIAAALAFALGFTVCAVMAILRHERAFSYAPLYSEQAGAISQIVRIAVISPWAFIGFENVSHFSEEYRFPVRRIRAILIFSVVVTTVLYLFVSLLSISAYPPEYESWLDYIRDMGNLDGPRAVPAFYAAEHYLGRTGVVILMLALLGVILTSLIGNLLALSRVLYAAGREGDAPRLFSELNGKGIPQKAIYAVVLLSAFIPLLGRTAIGWIVDVTTLGATLIYGFISQAVFHHARRAHRRLETVTGIIGLVLMLCFVLLTLVPGLLPFHAMETESYFLFIVWSLLGLAYFRWLLARDRDGEHNLRFIVWILFLFLVLFASIMCASRATEKAADEAVERIYLYHQSHPTVDIEKSEAERSLFLHEQARQISSTNTLYSLVSLGMFLLSVLIMLSNYRDTQRLGKQLSKARETAERMSDLATKDALTSVRNKGGFDLYMRELQDKLDRGELKDLAIGVFDCDDLKGINDRNGHDKGDEYLRAASGLICRVFKRSPVFRIGGDEFAVLLVHEDYTKQAELLDLFSQECRNICACAENEWNQVRVSVGIAIYDAKIDATVYETARRADKLMYENKRSRKRGRQREI